MNEAWRICSEYGLELVLDQTSKSLGEGCADLLQIAIPRLYPWFPKTQKQDGQGCDWRALTPELQWLPGGRIEVKTSAANYAFQHFHPDHGYDIAILCFFNTTAKSVNLKWCLKEDILAHAKEHYQGGKDFSLRLTAENFGAPPFRPIEELKEFWLSPEIFQAESNRASARVAALARLESQKYQQEAIARAKTFWRKKS